MARRPGKDAAPDFPIDFVVLWVDGGDPAWRTVMQAWWIASARGEDNNGICRYHDNGLLRYWFRGVERFAPWVRRVFFVTCGQRPAWLDPSHPKLRAVSHSEFIPADCLPTFNSRAIQLNLHRIPDLAEHFVLFDDDTFLLRPVAPSFYFRGGLPVLPASLRLPRYHWDQNWVRTAWNDFYEVNSHIDLARSIRANARKWFDPFALGPRHALGNYLRYRLNANLPVTNFGHLPSPHLKSTIAEVWRKCPESMKRTTRGRFRSHDQVCQWLFIAWNLATGRFHPVDLPYSTFVFDVTRKSVSTVCDAVRSAPKPQICLQEPPGNPDGDFCYAELAKAFEDLLPGRSSFELA
jgi:hypothetical protein